VGISGNGDGTAFRITRNGALTTLYTFCTLSGCTDGESPIAGLALATNGDLYGTTSHGGTSDDGTVFNITSSGALTTLFSFCSVGDCADGASPYGALVEGSNGEIYGTTAAGGPTVHMARSSR
jgi:uncharacterized repeat protein (TIGR03803 family)